MGCFDTLKVRCPACGTAIEFQSKAGDCRMRTYNRRNVPPEIAGALDGAIEECSKCERGVELFVTTNVEVGFVGDFAEEDEDYE